MSEVVVLAGADADLIDFYGRFEDLSEGLGDAFDEAYLEATHLLERHPEIGKRFGGQFRRLLLHRWNIGIFYTESGQRVFIHAIADLRQAHSPSDDGWACADSFPC